MGRVEHIFCLRNLQPPKEVFLQTTVRLDSREDHTLGELSKLSSESSFHWTLLVGEAY